MQTLKIKDFLPELPSSKEADRKANLFCKLIEQRYIYTFN